MYIKTDYTLKPEDADRVDSVWAGLVEKYEPLFSKKYTRDGSDTEYTFIGLLYAEDDIYFCMYSADGKPTLLSCVGSIESFGFKLITG